MFGAIDLKDILLPNFSHWIIWLVFLVITTGVIVLYKIPHIRKPEEEFRGHHISIPILSIISLYIFVKLLEGVIYQGSIIKVDEFVNAMMVTLHSNFLTSIAFFITSFGSGIPAAILTIVTVGILFLKKRWRFAVLASIAMVGATVMQVIIKILIGRSRPLNSLEIVTPGAFSNSFPSGHAITAIVFVSLLVYSFKDDIKHAAIKYLLITLASALFIIVGLTRIYLNVHWFSDVLAGMTLGLFWFMLIVLGERSIKGLVRAVKIETKEAEPIVPAIKNIVKE